MFTVTTGQDSGPGSLREVISRANKVHKATVTIAPSVGEKIILTDGEVVIRTNLKLVNRTKSNLVIYPTGAQRIFHVVAPSQVVEITSPNHTLLLMDGSADQGGAILVDPTDHYLILKGMTLTKNQAISGGAIFTRGRVVLDQVSIERNQAQSQGGGVWSGSGVFLKKSQVVHNRAGNGGGLFVAKGNLISEESQINDNSAPEGIGGGAVVLVGNIN